MKINYNSSRIKLNQTTIWNGSVWSNGIPNKNTIVNIQGVYNTTKHGRFSCLDLILTSGSLTININTKVSH